MKKLVTLFLSGLLLLANISYKPSICQGIINAHMDIQPRKIGVKASYRFIFTIEQNWELHDEITLIWPPGTNIDPPIPTEAKAKKLRLTQIIEAMTIGLIPCNACQGLPLIERQKDRSIKMVFKTHVAIDPQFPGYNPVVITVPESCGFTNPSKEGEYIYKVATRSEPDLTSCEPFEIVESRLGEPSVVVKPPLCQKEASYEISFQLGSGGALRKGLGIIKINFPLGTKISKIPGLINPANITVNGIPLLREPNGVRQNLNFLVPLDIMNSGKVLILISTNAGIINPEESGEYSLEVATSSDPQWTTSELYSIAEKGSHLEIKPPKINRIAEYSLTFILENQAIKMDQLITVVFPDTVTLPESFDSSLVLVNRKPCKSVEILNQTVQIVVGEDILPQSVVMVKFLLEAGIQNPDKPGKIRISYKTESLNDFQWTEPYPIVLQKLEIVSVTVSPPYAYETALYEIKVIFGDQKVPLIGDWITIKLPFQTDPIKIKITEEISQEYSIFLFEVENPDPGEYQLALFTTKETVPVISPIFTIEPSW